MRSSKELPIDTDQSSDASSMSYEEKLAQQFRKEVAEKSREYNKCVGNISSNYPKKRFEVNCTTDPQTYSKFAKNFPLLHGAFFPRSLEYKHTIEYNEDYKKITHETIDVKKYSPNGQ
jgi:hypothetical protein